MTLYLGNNLISGVATPTEPTRNLGQIIESILPLTDAGLHLLDGALINGSGIYSAFVDAIADLYSTSTKYSNVTKVGTLTDNDGVLSGFSANNYAKIPVTFSPNAQSWEIAIKAKFTSLSTNANLIAGQTNQFISLSVQTSGKLAFNIGNGSSWVSGDILSTNTFSTNTDYWFKLVFDGTTYKSYSSTDGETWTQEASYTGSISINGATLLLGVNRSIADPINGSIDLNSSYININGSRWWSGRMASGFTEESAWQSSVSTYGVCGKFVYDSVGNTVRLPKITGKIEGTTDATALGDLAAQYVKLPNISGNVGYIVFTDQGNHASGPFTLDSISGSANLSGNGNRQTVYFDASRSSSVYSGNGSDTKIHEQAIKCYYYIVIATMTKTEIEVDIDDVATDLNGKADIDFTNVNNTATSIGAKWGLPSGTTKTLTAGASGSTYTAPANGWVAVDSYVTGAYITLSCGRLRAIATKGSNTGIDMSIYIPVIKGATFQLSYDGTWSPRTWQGNTFVFFYAVGSESEAS